MTSLFHGDSKRGHNHSQGAKYLLRRFRVSGQTVKQHTAAEQSSDTTTKSCSLQGEQRKQGLRHDTSDDEVENSIDISQPILWQVGSLQGRYMEWVHTPLPGKPRFFRSEWAERVTKVKWWVVPLVWVPVMLATSIISARELPLIESIQYLMMGIILWQCIEYSLHRFLFHWEPRHPRAIFMHFLFHGCHHKFPMDIERLVFPPIPASWVALLIFSMLRLWCTLYVAMSIFSGALLGYIVYDCIHYFIHSGSVGGYLSRNHMKHHFEDPNHHYGISSPLLDIICDDVSQIWTKVLSYATTGKKWR